MGRRRGRHRGPVRASDHVETTHSGRQLPSAAISMRFPSSSDMVEWCPSARVAAPNDCAMASSARVDPGGGDGALVVRERPERSAAGCSGLDRFRSVTGRLQQQAPLILADQCYQRERSAGTQVGRDSGQVRDAPTGADVQPRTSEHRGRFTGPRSTPARASSPTPIPASPGSQHQETSAPQ